jgi:adenylosuccinate lyase
MGDSLENLSPIDGRYNAKTRALVPFFTEKALMKYRLLVESEYLIFLSENEHINIKEFSSDEISLLENLANNFSLEDALKVKGYEKVTNHDVKAIEYFMKEKLKETSLQDSTSWIHFALTSYDVNNIAISLMIRDATEQVILPVLENLNGSLDNMARQYAKTPMLARTHGQPASPTTFGKEMKVFSERLRSHLTQIRHGELEVKLNGATGNYNAHNAAFPDVDWVRFSEDFIERLNDINYDGKPSGVITLKPNLITTQIEPNDSLICFFDNYKRTNNLLVDFSRDMWQYISDNWILQKPKAGEVGSSTMPHKVNPIDFENAEGNLYLANGIFQVFSDRMQISRLQRDLSGSTIERNYGVAFSHSLIAYNSLLNGLGKIKVSEENMLNALNSHPEIVSEGIQTILRREGIDGAYEKLKELTRGNATTLDDIRTFADSLDVADSVKQEMKNITPATYLGIAERLATRNPVSKKTYQ